jgi:demethylspheroidene O-methyltransferase
LMNRKFHSFALKTPIFQIFARRAARDSFDLVAGFVYSQILLACVELKLFEHLKYGAQSADRLAELMGLSSARADALLSAAKSLGLVSDVGQGRYCLGYRGAAIAGNDGILDMIRHHRMFYEDLVDPVALLRGEMPSTGLAQYWSYGGNDPAMLSDAQVAPYTALMSKSQVLVADLVLDAYRFDHHQRLLDVGGGDGAFLMAVAARAPNLNLSLFDLPAVAARASDRLKTAGLAERATAFGGNFFVDALPKGADLVTLVRVVHDHNDDVVLKLLRRIRESMAPNGVLLIAEPMSGAAGAATVGDAYFGFYLMAMGRGRPRSAEALTQMLIQSGFDEIRELNTRLPLQCKVLAARIASKA